MIYKIIYLYFFEFIIALEIVCPAGISLGERNCRQKNASSLTKDGQEQVWKMKFSTIERQLLFETKTAQHLFILFIYYTFCVTKIKLKVVSQKNPCQMFFQ